MSEFNRIKQSSYFSPKNVYQVKPPTTLSQNIPKSDSTQRALSHKNKILEIEKKRDNDNNPLKYQELIRKEDPYKVVGGKNNQVVKQFDEICRKAKIATIWDRQMDERKMMEGMYINKEKRLDQMMELERLKEIKFIEEREKFSLNNKKLSQKAIIDQIYDNDFERNKKIEEKEREKILMLRQIEKMKDEDKQLIENKKIQKQKKIKEFVRDLDIMALNKKKKIIEEKEEDLKIKKFNLEKNAQEERFLAEKKRIAQLKERETAALREKQEKQKDKLDEVNEIKARKAMIEADMKEKQRVEEENLKRQKRIKEMIESNDLMLKIKKSLGEKEIEKDKEIVEKMKLESLKEEEEEKIKKRIKLEKMIENKIELEKQIMNKEKREKNKRIKELEEGKKISKEQDTYMKSLEEIRQQKIQELKDLNIKDAYIVPLQKYNYGYA